MTQTCQALWDVLVGEFLRQPTRQEWLKIADRYERKWNFPNCVGAMDGKHVIIKAPAHSGSLYFNYKGTFSIVLMAVVDADYRFILVDIGAYGSNADGGIFANSIFGDQFLERRLDVPDAAPILGYPEAGLMPFVLLGDEAFPLRIDLMRPYPGRGYMLLPENEDTFNYRLSRGRHVSENVFGIMVVRWGVFQGRINLAPENAQKVVMAAVVLHNYLTKDGEDLEATTRRLQDPTRPIINPEERGLQDLRIQRGKRYERAAKMCGSKFAQYFTSEQGRTGYQDRYRLLH